MPDWSTRSSNSQQLAPHLLRGERILWTGHPDPRRLVSKTDAYLIPFSLMWGCFALFWEGAAIASRAPFFFLVWGVPFVLVGQYFIWGRFIYKRHSRLQTIYAVTDQRILVLRGRTLQSTLLGQMPVLNEVTRRDGSGSLEFNNAPVGFGFWADTGMDWFAASRRAGLLAFHDIPNVHNVYQLVADARAAAAQ